MRADLTFEHASLWMLGNVLVVESLYAFAARHAIGVVSIEHAAPHRTAREKGLDLVEVAATADPPVCRIIDFGKFQYEAKKKANEAKKKQSVIVVKEVKFRPGTDDHDYDYRMKHAREWLAEGKVSDGDRDPRYVGSRTVLSGAGTAERHLQ